MPSHSTNTNHIGEMRQDPITGKWVTIATGRSKRPDDFQKENNHNPISNKKYKEDCPFCNLAKFPQEPSVLRLPDNDTNWQVHIFPNKYPAFSPDEDFKTWNEGPYRTVSNTGYHELLSPRHHNTADGIMSVNDFALQIEALVLRYRQLKTLPHINHIQIIKNHGEEAGGSLEHPHHQLFAIPVLPSDVKDLLEGSEKYAHEHNGESVFTAMLEYERENKTRIVIENEYFTAFCPYASRFPFETWIMPRTPDPFFEDMGPKEREALAEIMQQVFSKLNNAFKNLPYNYYIHSAPCDETGFVCDTQTYAKFRWHIQITPRLNNWGGFELGTGLEINTSAPEESAEFLREQPVT